MMLVPMLAVLIGRCAAPADIPELKGPYLGQKPPGRSPEVFAPGVVSHGFHEHGLTISPAGDEMFYATSSSDHAYYAIVRVVSERGLWADPEIAPFSGAFTDMGPRFSPDGRKLFFCSNRPSPGAAGEKGDYDLWVVERDGGAWSEPMPLGPPVNTDKNEAFPSIAADGALYYQAWGESGGESDIYCSRYVDGAYQRPGKVGSGISTEGYEGGPFVAPDESYLLFQAVRPDSSHGNTNIYVSFRLEDGTWGPPRNLGDEVNASGYPISPMVSPDGKYLFFATNAIREAFSYPGRSYAELIRSYRSHRNGYGTIWWMDARILDRFGGIPAARQAGSLDAPGPYLGQKLPGTTPVVFAPGIVSTEKGELNALVSPDGNEIYFSRAEPSRPTVIMVTRRTAGGWGHPAVASFSGTHSDMDPSMSADGSRLFFGSNRPGGNANARGCDIWMVTRRGPEEPWSAPTNIGAPVNTPENENYPTASGAGSLYFHSEGHGGMGGLDIFAAESRDGRYLTPRNLGREINSGRDEFDAFIARDERFIIFSSRGRADGFGSGDLYISFRGKDGSWTEARNMGDTINSPAMEYCPFLSPDGRFLFFTSGRSGSGDIYWVDAGVIETLMPEAEKRRSDHFSNSSSKENSLHSQ